jgi:hypothetical protein
MTRTYDVHATALALDVAPKWLDNLLSHHGIPGSKKGRQGVARRITNQSLTAIEVVRMLRTDLGVPIARAVELTAALLDKRQGDGDARMITDSGVVVTIPIAAIEARLRQQMVSALESVGQRRRGRPPRARPPE